MARNGRSQKCRRRHFDASHDAISPASSPARDLFRACPESDNTPSECAVDAGGTFQTVSLNFPEANGDFSLPGGLCLNFRQFAL